MALAGRKTEKYNTDIPESFKVRKDGNKSRSTKELYRMIAKTSGYKLYEVEDVMEHFVAHMQHLLKNQETVKVSGLGEFTIRIMPERLYHFKSGDRLLPASPMVKYKVDAYLRRLVKGKDAADNSGSSDDETEDQ